MSGYELYINALQQYRRYQRLCEARWAGSERARVDACRREWDAYIDSVFAYQRAGGHRPLPCFGA